MKDETTISLSRETKRRLEGLKDELDENASWTAFFEHICELHEGCKRPLADRVAERVVEHLERKGFGGH